MNPLRFLVPLALLVCGTSAAQSGSAKRLHPIALSGGEAPGVGTVFVDFQTPYGTTATTVPTLDAAGNAGVFARVVDPVDPTSTLSGIWKEVGGELRLVALRHDPAPGTPETFEAFPNAFFEVPPGIVASATSIVAATASMQGFWAERSGQLQLVVFDGQPLPGGPAGQSFRSPIGTLFADGSVLVAASWSTWRGDEGFWRDVSGSLQLVLRAGSQAPGMAAGVVFADANSLHLSGPFDRVDVDSLGRMAFNGTVAGPKVGKTNDEGIWRETALGTFELVVTEGDPAPQLRPNMRFGTGLGVRAFGGSAARTSVRSNDRGTLIFGAGHQGGGFDYVYALWRRFANGTLELVAVAEEPSSGFPGTIQPGTGQPFHRFFNHATINEQDRIAFQDKIDHPLNTFYNEETAIFWDQPGALALVIATESAVPGLNPGELVDSLALGELLDDGSLWATAWLKNGPRGPERALLFFEPDGTARVLIREGEVVDVTGAGDLRTIAELAVRGNGEGRRFGLHLLFTDGTSGLFRLDALPATREGRHPRRTGSAPRPAQRGPLAR